MYSDTGDTTSLVPGFPIRTSSDPRSVDSSPRHIAGSHVLHRLLMPRHPPCALKNLNTKVTRCSRSLCSSQNTNGHQPTPPPTTKPHKNQDSMRYGGKTSPHAEIPPTNPAAWDLHALEENNHQRGRSLRTQQCARPTPAHPAWLS